MAAATPGARPFPAPASASHGLRYSQYSERAAGWRRRNVTGGDIPEERGLPQIRQLLGGRMVTEFNTVLRREKVCLYFYVSVTHVSQGLEGSITQLRRRLPA